MSKFQIAPMTKVADILNNCPEILSDIFEIMPIVRNLENPSIREAVQDSLTIETVSKLQNCSVINLVKDLNVLINGTDVSEISEFPEWLNFDKITKTIDARPLLARGEHPVQLIMSESSMLNHGEILEMITPFRPAPLLDMLSQNGYRTFCKQESVDLFRNYFSK